ncbi:MAG: hypothetical protein M1281_07110 [Chloroflexi bacterium]|nr:hypothetical protein [Chloroflexota bacterium]
MVKLKSLFWSGKSIFVGIVIFGFLSGILQPIQNDTAHAIGLLNMQGGKALHEVHLVFGEGLFGRFTLLLTATVIPPVSGDILLEVSGPEKLDYSASSRYPPVIPILNRFHTWFSFENNLHKGVQPGDSLLIVMRIKPPQEAGEYAIVLKDANNGRVYLSQPVFFELPQKAGPGGKIEETCH